MPIDVRPDHLQMVQAILQAHVPEREVVAFGSRVQGRARKTSDLDLCIKGEPALDWATLSHLRDAFSLSVIPYKVDVVEWSQLTPAFQAIVTEQAVTMQSAQ